MAILDHDEYFNRLHERLGDDTSDEGISFLEDMTDTYNDLANRANGDGIDWKAKYQELDESWKKRYRHRFFSGGDTGVPDQYDTEDNGEHPEDITFDDLFKRRDK